MEDVNRSSVRRDTGHTHKHTTRTTPHNTTQEQHHKRPHEEPPPALDNDRRWRGDGAHYLVHPGGWPHREMVVWVGAVCIPRKLPIGSQSHSRISSVCVCARVPFVYTPSVNGSSVNQLGAAGSLEGGNGLWMGDVNRRSVNRSSVNRLGATDRLDSGYAVNGRCE